MAEERKRNELEAAVTAFRDAEPEERTAMNAALTRNEAGILDGLAQEAAEAAAAAARWSRLPPSPPWETEGEPEPEHVPPEGKLTPRQDEFCRHYAAQPVATRAAVLAGYSEDNASGYGSRLLKNPLILDRIAAFRAAERIHYVLERDTVHDKLEALFFDALGHRNHAAAVSALKLQAALAGMFQRQPAEAAEPQALPGEKAKKSQPRRSKKPRKAKVGARQKPGKAKKSQGKPR